ncbi:MAG: hypothetical protein RBS16_04370 [Candidatus Cloacimonadales bacterium]|jgi:hypothetical protein|nr:hypothetical protein [Candidatus Cloacimonadales bacterium]
MISNDTLLKCLDDIINFAKKKTIYEFEKQVNDAINLFHREKYLAKSEWNQKITINYNMVKCKLEDLKNLSEQMPLEYRGVLSPLIADTEDYLLSLKILRETQKTRG